jgi:glycosyltransferase involved in cell wall biosynthesis
MYLMKILMITRTLAEFSNLQGKLREIARRGVELTVVSPPQWVGKAGEVKKVRADGYRFLVRPCQFSSTASVRVGNHLHFYPGISSIIAEDDWDLVHIDEEPFNLATYHGLKACRRSGRRAIFASWQNSMKRYPPPFNWFESYVFEHIVGAIAGNAEVLDVLRRRGFHKPAAHIPQLGVDPTLFRRQDASELRRKLCVDDKFTIGFVGRFWPVKAVDTLIKGFALLPKDCALVLVGDGSERLKLEALVQELDVSERVRWVPWVNSWDVPEYMNAFDVLVLPSRTRWNIKEQFGRVLVEAMACETCVVGSDSGEIPRVIGDAGLIFHEDHELELADCLRLLKDAPLRREAFCRRGRDRVIEHFSYARIAKDTVNFYKSVCLEAESCDQPSRPGERVIASVV